MPPEDPVHGMNKTVTPQYSPVTVGNHIVIHIENGTFPTDCIIGFYIQMRKLLAAVYKAILITGKNMLINEYQYLNRYQISVAYVPTFTNTYKYVEFEVDFSKEIRPQANKLQEGLVKVLENASQLDDSPFTDIWFR